MEIREITWHSKVCPCSFRVRFDRDKPTADRVDDTDFTLVRKETHKQVLNVQDYSCEPLEIACPTHKDMDHLSAFVNCKKMHMDAGVDMGIRHMTANSHAFDTCGCAVELEFDRMEPAESRTHHLGASLKKCQHHKDITGHNHHVVTFQENHKKNSALNHVIEQLPDEHFNSLENWDGNVTKNPKWLPRFKYDANRKLTIELHRSQKKHLQEISKSLKEKHPDVSLE